MPTQLVVLPAMFALARAEHPSMRRWCEQWARKPSRCAWTGCFLFIFAAFLLLDFVNPHCVVHMRPLMVAHHAVCALGHVYAAFVTPLGLPYYFAGVVAFELGSATCNIVCLWGAASPVYAVGMSLSNTAALVCSTGWAKAIGPRPRSKAFGLMLSALLAMMRQREVLNFYSFPSRTFTRAAVL